MVHKTERLEIRIESDKKELIRQVSMLCGFKSVAEYATYIMVEEAKKVALINNIDEIKIDGVEKCIFVVSKPRVKSKRLTTAIRKYEELKKLLPKPKR